MPAYCLFDILEITDEDKFEEYRTKVFATVEQYNGRYLVIGGQYEKLEGDWSPVFPVVIEFPDKDQAKRWYDSAEYREIKDLRVDGTRSNGVVLEGLP